MADIGEDVKTVEFEPLPESVPSEAPVPTPTPEKVPA